MDVKAYWAYVYRLRDGGVMPEIGVTTPLPEFCYITSLANLSTRAKAGVVFQADRETTARRLVEGTHRLSTPDEIAGEKKRDEKYVREVAREELKRKNTIQITAEQAQELYPGAFEEKGRQGRVSA